jgi:hypothetical protein
MVHEGMSQHSRVSEPPGQLFQLLGAGPGLLILPGLTSERTLDTLIVSHQAPETRVVFVLQRGISCCNEASQVLR